MGLYVVFLNSFLSRCSRCAPEGHRWCLDPCCDPPNPLQPTSRNGTRCAGTIAHPWTPLFIVCPLQFFPMGPWPVRGKGHCKYCTEILPPSHRAPEDGTGDQWVSTSFLRRAFSTVRHQTSMNPSMSKIAAVRSYAQCWHYNNLGRSRLFVKHISAISTYVPSQSCNLSRKLGHAHLCSLIISHSCSLTGLCYC